MNDRSQDVRMAFYDVLQYWMTEMEIKSLRQFEHHFILFLLNGIADENADISSKCKIHLEEYGKNMKDALIKLGEEKPDEESNSMEVD
jgi:hypothetical protein